MRISDWSSDVCSSDLAEATSRNGRHEVERIGAVPMHRCNARQPKGAEQVKGVEFHHPNTPIISAPQAIPNSHHRKRLGAPPKASCHPRRLEEHTSELQSLMRISYAVFCLKNKTHNT